MEINSSVQFSIEQALKFLIPYLQVLPDPQGIWDFVDEFPPASSTTFLYLSGHEATALPDKLGGYLAFTAGLPNLRAIGSRYPNIMVRMELATSGIGDKETRLAAVVTHSRRLAALIRLFSPLYFENLREVLNLSGAPDNFMWKGLGFDAWNAEPPTDGQSANGNAFVATLPYIFVVHFDLQPAI